ncbi:MAG: hypothetical protein ACRDQZ_23145 [Mycobacteriales bacterium]
MAELLLVNPSKRKGHKRRKGRMPAALAAYCAKRGRSRKSNPTGRKRRRRRNPSLRAIHRRRRRNPSLRSMIPSTASVMGTLQSGFTGSIGAIGNDLLMGQVLNATFTPTFLKTGIGATLTRALGALVIGIVGGFAWKGHGRELGDGAMTVALHDALKAQLSTLLPASLPLSGLGEYLTFAPTVGYSSGGYNPQLMSGLGEYISADIGNGDYYGAGAGNGQLGLYLT